MSFTLTRRAPFGGLPLGRERTKRVLLSLLAMLSPLLVAWLLTFLQGRDLFFSIPRWADDELWWSAQYAAMSKYGRPLGYFGYAGTHADVGTWGPWGMYPTLTTGLLSRVFGWGLHAFIYYNYFYLAVSMLIFILLTRPSARGLAMLAAANATAYIAVCYSIISMNEIIRCALALILSGIMFRIIVTPKVSWTRLILRCTLVPLLLVYAALSYILLAAFIPIYLFLMLRRLRLWCRVPVTLAASYFAIDRIRLTNVATCAPYIVPEKPVSYTLPTFRLRLTDFYHTTLGKLSTLDPFYLLFRTEDPDNARILLWYCTLLYVCMGVLVWRLMVNRKKPEKRVIFSVELMSLYLLLCYWGGHVVLYDTTDWTFMRGCYGAIYCAVMLGCLMPKGDDQLRRAAMTVSAVGIITFVFCFTSVFSRADHFSTPAQDAAWDAERAAMERVVVLDPDAEDPWSNTVVLCSAAKEVYYILPYGVGVNGPSEDAINVNARYVFLGYDCGEEERDSQLRQLLDSGHVVVYENQYGSVLQNTARSYG